MKRAVFIFALAIGVLFAGISLADEGVNEKLAICAKMEDGAKRLECYDSIAMKKEDEKSENAENEKRENWITYEDVNKMDDSKIITLVTRSKEEIYNGTSTVSPRLYIRCRKNKTDAFIVWDSFITDSESTTTVRLDNEKAKKVYGNPSTDNDAVFFNSPINFIKSLYGHKRLLAQVTPYRKFPITAEFDITGIEEAIEPICKECGWK